MVKRIVVIILVLGVAFGLGLLVKVPRVDAPSTPNESQEDVTSEQDVDTETNRQTYTSPFGFSFTYSEPFSLENSWIVLPPNKRIASVAAVRYVTTQDCGESGLAEHCRPFLENPAIAFGVIDMRPGDVVSEYLSDIVSLLEPVTVAGKRAAQYYAGVEGRGVVTMLIPLKNTQQTLVVQYTYDEFFDQVPKDGVWGSVAQKQTVDAILNTLVIE